MKIRTIGIVGSGAVGIYYGSRILEAGGEVRFLLRGDYEVVQERGFEVRSVDGDLSLPSPQCYRDAAEMGPVDLVIVAWKATANAYAQEVITPLLHDESKILTLQNGLGNVELLEELFGPERVLGGLCFVCINRLSEGVIAHSAGGMVTVGEPAETGALEAVVSLFGPQVKAVSVANLGLAQWRKLVWNIPFNGLCVREGGIDTQELLKREGGVAEVHTLMGEVLAAAKALGYEIPESFIENQIEKTLAMGAYLPSSALDYRAKLPLEVEAIWGEPLRRAQAAGVQVPAMEALYHRLGEIDAER